MPRPMNIDERYNGVLSFFESTNAPDKPELMYHDAFSLLVAVVLSAQCTDRRVNMVTPQLLRHYPTPLELANANIDNVLDDIKSISYPNAKARHLVAMAQKLVADFNCRVPDSREQLMTLPGVGRKTANVVLAVCFNQPTMAVDTHVLRVSQRIGLSTGKKPTPLSTEQDLVRHIPPQLIPRAHHWLILHGRYTCTARNPKCQLCGIAEYCKHYQLRKNI